MNITAKQIEYVQSVLSEKLIEDCGKYVALQMSLQTDEGKNIFAIFGDITRDTGLDENCEAVNWAYQMLENVKTKIKGRETRANEPKPE